MQRETVLYPCGCHGTGIKDRVPRHCGLHGLPGDEHAIVPHEAGVLTINPQPQPDEPPANQEIENAN